MKNKYIISGSIIASIFASICCIGPLVLALLGLTGVAAFSFLEPLRPYLISASIILFVFAFYFVYRKKEIIKEDGSRKIVTTGKRDKLLVWIALVVSLIIILFPLFESNAESTANNLKQRNNSTVMEQKLHANSTCADSCK